MKSSPNHVLKVGVGVIHKDEVEVIRKDGAVVEAVAEGVDQIEIPTIRRQYSQHQRQISAVTVANNLISNRKSVLPEAKHAHIVGKLDISSQSAARNKLALVQHRKSSHRAPWKHRLRAIANGAQKIPGNSYRKANLIVSILA